MHVLLSCIFAGLVTMYVLHSFAVGLYGTTNDLNKILDGQCDVGRLTSFVFYFPAFLIRICKFLVVSIFNNPEVKHGSN